MDTTAVISLATFIAVLALLVLLRTRNEKFEIKSGDAVIAILPIAIFLLVTGKIKSFALGDLKVETAFNEASKLPIAPQIAPLTSLPWKPIQADSKGPVDQISLLLAKRTEVLSFQLGYAGYAGWAIREYLRALSGQPFLTYSVITDRDGTFYAMADVRSQYAALMAAEPAYTADAFASWLTEGDKSRFTGLAGFLFVDDAVTEKTDKRMALQKMEEKKVDTLPVIGDADRRFRGIVERSRLTASLILEFGKNLDETGRGR